MIVNPGIRRFLGSRGGIPIANRAAHFDAAVGITESGGFASAWADQSGNGRNLLQATGANQPIHLPFDGTKYGWLPGVAGNYFSTPDSVAASITGDIDIRVKAALVDWTPAAATVLLDKMDSAGNQRAYQCYINTDGTVGAGFDADGSAPVTTVTSTASVSFSAGETGWVRITRAASTGYVNFYTSSDGVSWAQLGNADVASYVGAIFDSSSTLYLGAIVGGATNNLSGKIYQAQIYNGIDGTLAVDFDPSRWSSGSTFTASTGETWTINSTGSKPAQIVDRASLLFDGAAHFMKCNAFTLNQPETLYWVGKQISWTGSDVIADGNAANTLRFYQTTASPQLFIYGGASLVGPVSSLAVGDKGVVGIVVNGGASSIQHNLNTAVTGAGFGAANMGGLTLGAKGDLVGFGNIQVFEALIYNTAHDASTRANVIRALMSKHGVA